MVFICILDMINDIEHLSMCLLATGWFTYLVKCLFKSFGFFFFFALFKEH
jgi:hypothetical protein